MKEFYIVYRFLGCNRIYKIFKVSEGAYYVHIPGYPSYLGRVEKIKKKLTIQILDLIFLNSVFTKAVFTSSVDELVSKLALVETKNYYIVNKI